MKLTILKPRQALNKAFLKVKPNRTEIENFKINLVQLLDHINENESEEFHKNIINAFLNATYYSGKHYINTKGRNDQVIHNGIDAKSTVGVIIEAKKPANKAEMLKKDNLNTKAFQELVLYYLRERITNKNLEVKWLVATNIYEWFFFDAQIFEKAFAQNKGLVNQFTDFEEGRMGGKTTDFFYKEIAGPAIAALTMEIPFTHFDIRDYEKPLRNTDKADDNKLIALYKLLSPQHLLKLPFANDSNSLDKTFYAELLHIIGLVETKDGGKKLIGRKKEGERNAGSLLENAILQVDSLDKISRLHKASQFGETNADRLYNVSLELCITWINRILFLKLLEAQLINYHKGDKSFLFLHLEKVKSFDDLNSLFFQVLARKTNERSTAMQKLFEKVPYLNSSLFEPTDIEHQTLFISQLADDIKLPVIAGSVLKDKTGKKTSGEINALEYLFDFLSAYDFSSEGAEDIQEDNKKLINASVLGLIFEKINGYKDGSFFTPGFITMYMCRETIRRSVLQKFNDTKQWNCKDFSELYDKIDNRQEANDLINSITICDPAVGSGHFLVSALNEMIAVKNDLRILQDRQGHRLKEYHVLIENDELIVTDEEDRLFEYNPRSKENQRIQETLFHEKQTIIENCLFGVDINPNSVKICRLRLWIELLKNAYYKVGSDYTELETLPNIDINIKCGNSLISRFGLDADLKPALQKSRFSITAYRSAVQTYRHAQSKEEKREMQQLIDTIKNDFETFVSVNDKRVKDLSKTRGELFKLTQRTELFAEAGSKKTTDWKKQVEKLTKEIAAQEANLEDIKNNRIYENAFEWRFEFPEVLDDEGEFVGFDVVMGNPPYIRQEEIRELKPFLQNNYVTYAGTADLYVFFVERGIGILKEGGKFCYILPNKWMKAGYGKSLREFVAKKQTEMIIDFGDLPVFEEATIYPSIWIINNILISENNFSAALVDTLIFPKGLSKYIENRFIKISNDSLRSDNWNLVDNSLQLILNKIRLAGKPLIDYVDGKIYRGVLTGLNEAFVIDKQTKDYLTSADAKSAEIIKPFLAGKDIKRYLEPHSEKFLIFTKRGIQIEKYPEILRYLEKFRTQLEPKPRDWKGDKWKGRKEGTYKWYEIQDAVDYYQEFEQPKILWPGITDVINSFTFDTNKYYGNDNNQLIVTDDLSILGILNSSVTKWFLSLRCDFVRGGFIRLKIIYVQEIPIPNISMETKHTIQKLVSQILSIKQESPSSDTKYLEAEIDNLVYKLYGLNDNEIKIIEGAEIN